MPPVQKTCHAQQHRAYANAVTVSASAARARNQSSMLGFFSSFRVLNPQEKRRCRGVREFSNV